MKNELYGTKSTTKQAPASFGGKGKAKKVAKVTETGNWFLQVLLPAGSNFLAASGHAFSVVQRDREQCIKGCKACQMVCPASLELPSKEEGDNAMSGECFACGKCAERCPRRNAERPFPGKYLKSK